MATDIGAALRGVIQSGVAEGLAYNDLYSQVAFQSAEPVSSSVFAREWNYAKGLAANMVDYTGSARDQLRGLVPTVDVITPSPVNWPDRFNVRVRLSGRDTETGQFSNAWLNLGYDRLPSFGTIADTALTLGLLGESNPSFEVTGVSGMTIESSASAYWPA